MNLSAIVAVSRNGFIGAYGGLPWTAPEDLSFFKHTTQGHTVIMGRHTWDSIGCHPLPKRHNIVVTRNRSFLAHGCTHVHFIEDAFKFISPFDTEPFIIGGAQLYTETLPLVNKIYLTEVGMNITHGDVRFPVLSSNDWVEIGRRPGQSQLLTFVTLVRKNHEEI